MSVGAVVRSTAGDGSSMVVPWLVGTTAIAVLLRLWVLMWFFDTPGDGPSRAAIAQAWAGHPYLPTCGGWPPGHMVLAGMWSWIVPAPLWSSRLLGVILGSLSVPLALAIAARSWDLRVGIVAAVALALFPLHVELSATGLTEPIFLFSVLAGWWVLLVAADATRLLARGALLVSGAAALVLAEMTRYEGWLLAPLFLAWWALRTRRAPSSFALAALLLAFPVAWTLGNARCGDAFVGFHAALQEPAAGAGLKLGAATLYAATLGIREVGAALAVCAFVGVGCEVAAVLRRRSTSERLLALGLFAVGWVFLVTFSMGRGASAWNRYGLAPFVFGVLFTGVPFAATRLARRWRVAMIAAVVLVTTSFASTLVTGVRVNRWVRATASAEARDVAAWLGADPARSDLLVVTTPVGWELTFLALYRPAAYDKVCTISSWTSDPDVATLVASLRGAAPFVFVTRPGDDEDLARLERAIGSPLLVTAPVLETGNVRLYLLRLRGRVEALTG